MKNESSKTNEFETNVMDYYDEVDGSHYFRQSPNLMFLLTFVKSSDCSWRIDKCDCVVGFYSAGRVAVFPKKFVARSATYQGF